MTQEHPPELKGFHARNMRQAVLVWLIPAAAGIWAFYRQEAFAAKDALQSALTVVFLVGITAFMVTILIKALLTLPKCPECSRTMTEGETLKISTTIWKM